MCYVNSHFTYFLTYFSRFGQRCDSCVRCLPCLLRLLRTLLRALRCMETSLKLTSVCQSSTSTCCVYRVVEKTDTQFYFWDNFGNSAPILTILWISFTVASRNLWCVNVKFFHPPHLYCVTTLPSKTNTVKATVVSEKRQHIKISIS